MDFFLSLITNLLSGLAGAGIGLAGSRWIEERRGKQQRNAAMAAVLSEMALLSAALEYAAEGKRLRATLTKNFWDRFGPDLVNYLPLPLYKLLFVTYEDNFDTLRMLYDEGTSERGLTETQMEIARAKFLSAAFAMTWVQGRINEHFESKSRIRNTNSNEPSEFMSLIKRLDQDTIGYLNQKGFSIPEGTDMHDPGILFEHKSI